MQAFWQGRITQAAAKYGEFAPAATACCNTCRTCVTTNVLTAATAGVAAAGTFVAQRLLRGGPKT
jgi:hypothetical protein